MTEAVGGGRADITVKVMGKNYTKAVHQAWRRQLPDARPEWGRCHFTFDQDCRQYDWIAVYDDLSPAHDERFSVRSELLACPPEHTILVTAEPSPIKRYGEDYLRQFGVVLTAQEEWAMPLPNVVRKQAGLRWFYGMADSERLSLDRMIAEPPEAKSRLISTVCSTKTRGSSTLHAARVRFTDELQKALPELDRFGHGVRPIRDKAEALDAYRYHVAVENHIAPHYWTEKISDAWLGLALPFYCGCPNIDEYFPPESYIAFDVNDFPAALEIIRAAIAGGEYEKRLPFIREARRRVLEEQNLFAGFAREIEARHDPRRPMVAGAKLYSRRAIRFKSLGHFARSLRDKIRTKPGPPA